MVVVYSIVSKVVHDDHLLTTVCSIDDIGLMPHRRPMHVVCKYTYTLSLLIHGSHSLLD